ncbi:MAG: hypothetical protein FP816_20540 [Desulfobacteraceae bacterium]|nr:hypothetical protein [Desulfobacteraceae bacterium]
MNLSGRRAKIQSAYIVILSIVLIFSSLIGEEIGQARASEHILHYYDKFLDVQMLDTGQVWAVGHMGKLIYSEDYGKHWVALNTKTNKGLYSVYFITPETGWITGESGVILYTEDGGKTFTQQAEGVTNLPLFNSFFLNKKNGWAVGVWGTVLTTNDGVNWRKTDFNKDLVINDIYFFDENKGYAACEFDTVMMTEDGGETWKALLKTDDWDTGNFFGIDFIDENTAVIVGTSGDIKYTKDGGQTWEDAKNNGPWEESAYNNDPGRSTLLNVRFFNDKQGVAIGLEGAILSTKDGGLSWDPPSLITQFTWFSGISLLENGKGIIVGMANIIITNDFGKTWVSPFENMTK